MSPSLALAGALATSVLAGAFVSTGAQAAPHHRLAAPLCRSLSAEVAAGSSGRGPVFLASYRSGPGEAAVPLPLRSSAFSYDNALAAIALVACGDLASARRVADAFLHALGNDRTFGDGRIRNAYRAGGVAPVVLLPGWWEPSTKSWAEDPYQNGTATGNVAWVALSLLTLAQATDDARYVAGTRTLLDWIARNAQDPDGAKPGVLGGFDGFDPSQTRLAWKSSEHNVDVLAVALWYGRATRDGAFSALASSSRRFVDDAFLPGPGCFAMGTGPDGRMNGDGHLALDAQLWPLFAVADAPTEWQRALGCAEARMGVPGGFDFDDDRDGLWVEGTAQAAFTYRALGRGERANELLDGLAREVSGSGWLYATREPRLTTGLKIGPQSTTKDFFYFRRPHLGATAWAVLAATGWNPFTGQRLD